MADTTSPDPLLAILESDDPDLDDDWATVTGSTVSQQDEVETLRYVYADPGDLWDGETDG